MHWRVLRSGGQSFSPPSAPEEHYVCTNAKSVENPRNGRVRGEAPAEPSSDQEVYYQIAARREPRASPSRFGCISQIGHTNNQNRPEFLPFVCTPRCGRTTVCDAFNVERNPWSWSAIRTQAGNVALTNHRQKMAAKNGCPRWVSLSRIGFSGPWFQEFRVSIQSVLRFAADWLASRNTSIC